MFRAEANYGKAIHEKMHNPTPKKTVSERTQKTVNVGKENLAKENNNNNMNVNRSIKSPTSLLQELSSALQNLANKISNLFSSIFGNKSYTSINQEKTSILKADNKEKAPAINLNFINEDMAKISQDGSIYQKDLGRNSNQTFTIISEDTSFVLSPYENEQDIEQEKLKRLEKGTTELDKFLSDHNLKSCKNLLKLLMTQRITEYPVEYKALRETAYFQAVNKYTEIAKSLKNENGVRLNDTQTLNWEFKIITNANGVTKIQITGKSKSHFFLNDLGINQFELHPPLTIDIRFDLTVKDGKVISIRNENVSERKKALEFNEKNLKTEIEKYKKSRDIRHESIKTAMESALNHPQNALEGLSDLNDYTFTIEETNSFKKVKVSNHGTEVKNLDVDYTNIKQFLEKNTLSSLEPLLRTLMSPAIKSINLESQQRLLAFQSALEKKEGRTIESQSELKYDFKINEWGDEIFIEVSGENIFRFNTEPIKTLKIPQVFNIKIMKTDIQNGKIMNFEVF